MHSITSNIDEKILDHNFVYDIIEGYRSSAFREFSDYHVIFRAIYIYYGPYISMNKWSFHDL